LIFRLGATDMLAPTASIAAHERHEELGFELVASKWGLPRFGRGCILRGHGGVIPCVASGASGQVGRLTISPPWSDNRGGFVFMAQIGPVVYKSLTLHD